MSVHRFGWRADIASLTVKTDSAEIVVDGYQSSPDSETSKAIAAGVLEGVKGWIQ